jgi:bacterioferritin-associated ferredoxin
MFVCLCRGVTSHVVDEVVAAGAKTSKEIAEACGAGSDCGRCRRTLRAILSAHQVNGCPAGGTDQCPASGPAPLNGHSSRAAR